MMHAVPFVVYKLWATMTARANPFTMYLTKVRSRRSCQDRSEIVCHRDNIAYEPTSIGLSFSALVVNAARVCGLRSAKRLEGVPTYFVCGSCVHALARDWIPARSTLDSPNCPYRKTTRSRCKLHSCYESHPPHQEHYTWRRFLCTGKISAACREGFATTGSKRVLNFLNIIIIIKGRLLWVCS